VIELRAVPAISSYLRDATHAVGSIPLDQVARAVELVIEAYRRECRMLIFGNGGSAATASHFACDLAKNTLVEGRPRPRVLSLNDNVALLTAVSNDLAYEAVFAEQIETWAEPGDLVIAISASGNSPNVLAAVEVAQRRGAAVIGLTGFGGGRLAQLAQAPVVVDSHDFAWVESAHLVIEHLITYALRDYIRSPWLPTA
jgi:D-sedoheptulose 7-phosphate isomerase